MSATYKPVTLNCSCWRHIINILLTELSRSVWENLDLRRVYRHHCVRSVLTTSVKILPHRPPARLIRAKYSPIFKIARVARKIWRIINTIVSIWGENMFGYLSLDIICSEKRTVFRERSSRKTVSFEEQIMSADKYPSIFSRQMETIVYVFPNFQNRECSVKYLKDNKDYSLHLAKNMLGYLPLDIICSSKLIVFLELHSRKTVRFSEQIMSADKYPCLVNSQLRLLHF